MDWNTPFILHFNNTCFRSFFFSFLSPQVLLEEKQRARRRKREALQSEASELATAGNHEEAAKLEKEATYSPVWFKKEYDPLSNTMMHVYKGGYWELKKTGNWESINLTDIFET